MVLFVSGVGDEECEMLAAAAKAANGMSWVSLMAAGIQLKKSP